MVQPPTGTTPAAGGYTDVDNRFQGGHRTGLIAVLFRDAHGADTDISPHNSNGTVKWSPLAQDGQLRDDLFAFKREAGGFWVVNEDANEGWHLAGAFGEGKGPSTKPKIDTDDQAIEQTNWPFDSVITKQDEPFTFQALQNLQPAIMRLRNNLPLSASNGDLLVEAPGQPDAGYSQPLETDTIDRQFLLYGIRKRQGRYQFEVEAYDCTQLSDIGERTYGKKGTAAELTYKPIPSGFYMAMVDGEYKPVIKHTFVGGDAWAALYGSPVSQYLVTLGAQSSGTFSLGLDAAGDSGTIAFGATNAQVKTALVAIDDGYTTLDWTVTGSAGGPYTVTTPAGRVLLGSGALLGTPGTFVIAPVV